MDLTWSLLRDKYYKKEEVYDMCWKGVDFVRNMVIGGPLGGPIAVTRQESIAQKVGPGSLRPTIDIYTSSGQLLSSFVWEGGRIVKIGWDDIERLIVVLEDGSVHLYNVLGELQKRFSLDRKEIKENGVIDAFIWSSGLVCLTRNLQFFCMMNFDEPYIVKLKDPKLEAPPTCWTVIEPQLTETSTVQVLVATQSGAILSVDTEQAQDMLVPNGPFLSMAVAPTGKILACFTKSGNVWIVSTDFAQNLSTFETKSPVPPTQMVWCGFGAVCCYWGSDEGHLLFVVGPHASYYRYNYADPICLIPEPDGVRIISARKCEFLQRVSNATEAVFKSNSTNPAAILKEAYEEFEENSPKSDELIRDIGEDLTVAIDNVIEAAAMEFEPQQQKLLLKAASFGKAFRDFYPPDKFVEVCKTLRILNQVRDYRIGMPLTYAQYKILGADLLIERLINRNLHYMAFKICEFLGLNTPGENGKPSAADKVLIHWACAKVRANAPQLTEDEPTLRNFVAQIVHKLSACPGISYAEIASTAFKAGKHRLATMLLDYEPRAQDQVPLLISMRQPERALEKAIESGDSDLVHLVINHLRRVLDRNQFYGVLSRYETALSLYTRYCKERNLEELKDLYEFQNRPDLIAFVHVKKAHATQDSNERKEHLRAALSYYKQANSFAAKATEEQIALLLQQKDLEGSLGGSFEGSSLSSTIYRCILMGDSKRAAKIRDEFKIPNERYWWLKIKALAEVGDWIELEKFSKEKKSPIGYRPFAEVCIEHRNFNEAHKYIRKVAEPDIRARLYIRIKAWVDAFQAAKESKDPHILSLVRKHCRDPGLAAQIDAILQQINS